MSGKSLHVEAMPSLACHQSATGVYSPRQSGKVLRHWHIGIVWKAGEWAENVPRWFLSRLVSFLDILCTIYFCISFVLLPFQCAQLKNNKANLFGLDTGYDGKAKNICQTMFTFPSLASAAHFHASWTINPFFGPFLVIWDQKFIHSLCNPLGKVKADRSLLEGSGSQTKSHS